MIKKKKKEKKVNSQLLNAGLLYFKSFESASYYESTQMKMNIVAQPQYADTLSVYCR